MQLGDHYQQHGMREKAARKYQELVQLYPNSEWAEEAHFRTSLLLKRERKWAEAAEEMEKFLHHYSKSHLLVEAQVELGDLYFVLKDYPKALERYEWVVKHHPQHRLVRKVYLGMEEGHRNSGKTDQAEKILKELVAMPLVTRSISKAISDWGCFTWVKRDLKTPLLLFQQPSRVLKKGWPARPSSSWGRPT